MILSKGVRVIADEGKGLGESGANERPTAGMREKDFVQNSERKSDGKQYNGMKKKSRQNNYNAWKYSI